MFGIGIIGCGKIAQVRHIPEYAEHKDAKLLGFYDINLERAKALADQYGGTAYATAEELLANPDIAAVSICAANFAHAELTIAALNGIRAAAMMTVSDQVFGAKRATEAIIAQGVDRMIRVAIRAARQIMD
jgi:predicted dinucleotide-utilizing enzyme